jgi:hypothetical protein
VLRFGRIVLPVYFVAFQLTPDGRDGATKLSGNVPERVALSFQY